MSSSSSSVKAGKCLRKRSTYGNDEWRCKFTCAHGPLEEHKEDKNEIAFDQKLIQVDESYIIIDTQLEKKIIEVDE